MKALLSLVLVASITRDVISVTKWPPVTIFPREMASSPVGTGRSDNLAKGERSRQSGAITLDPVSIISLLALGAFLINNILQLLKTNQLMNNSGRSLEVADLDLPLELSDLDPNGRNRDLTDDNRKFTMGNLLGNVGSLYFVSREKRSACLTKILLCSKDEVSSQIRETLGVSSMLFDFLLSIVTSMVTPELMRGTTRRPCQSLNKICSEGILKEAELVTHNRIYSLLSTYGVQRMISG